MNLFGCLLMIFLVPIIMVFGTILNIWFRLSGKNPYNTFQQKSGQQQSRGSYNGDFFDKGKKRDQQSASQQQNQNANGKKQIIRDDEGEYVDYEEV